MNDEEIKDGMSGFLPLYDSEAEPVHWLSEEVKEVLGCDLPDIDHFQKHRAIIGIPREVISDIIHKRNSMRLIVAPFRGGKDMGSAFDMNLRMLHWGVNDIIDCFSAVFIGKDVRITAADITNFASHVDEVLPESVEPFWGFYVCDDMPGDFAQIITVATKKRNNQPFS